MRVLVTDSNNRSALAATRSLARAGHVVLTSGERRDSLAAVSRYSTAFVEYPPPSVDSGRFVDAVVTAIQRNSIDAVLPMTEITTLLLTEHRDRLPAGCRLPFASADSISRASDKLAMIRLAQGLDVPVPATMVLNAPGDAIGIAPPFDFPMVVKPARSRVRTPDGWHSSSVTYARDIDELGAKLGALHPAAYPVLLQERIRGRGVGLFACYMDGRPVALFSHRRLREKPPSGGVSVLCESVPLDDRAVLYAGRLLERLHWHGVAMVEFKEDDRDGSLRLMEINSRFWGSLQLAISSGVDFPVIAVAVANGTPPEPVFSYRVGVRNRWFLGDLDALGTVLLHRRSNLNLPKGYPSRARLAWDFMHLLGRDLHYEVWSLSDPRPGLLELRHWLRHR